MAHQQPSITSSAEVRTDAKGARGKARALHRHKLDGVDALLLTHLRRPATGYTQGIAVLVLDLVVEVLALCIGVDGCALSIVLWR
jgi:hypothetical protein